MEKIYLYILMGFIALLVLFMFGFRSITSDLEIKNSHIHDSSQCRKLESMLNTKQKFTMKLNPQNSWNYQFVIKELDLTSIQIKCPSVNFGVEFLYSKELIAYNENFDSDTVYFYDCHQSVFASINYNPTVDKSVQKFDILADVRSGDSANYLYGYIVKLEGESNDYMIIDSRKKTVATLNQDKSDIAYTINLIDTKHPAANPNIVLTFLAKEYFKIANDGCNVKYSRVSSLNFLCMLVATIASFVLIFLYFTKFRNTASEEDGERASENKKILHGEAEMREQTP